MDTVDITPTPEACCQIARLFRAQKADAKALASCAARALDALDATDDAALAPGAVPSSPPPSRRCTTPSARVRHMDEGLEAIAPYANATDREGSDDAA